MINFRLAAWNLSPSRLRTAKAARIVYAFIGVPLDCLAGAAELAIKARFPELAPEDALNVIGRDRGIVRGPLESAASYRARLLLWLASWRGAGVGRAMLDQIAGYLTPSAVRLRIWTQTGVVYTREADGTFTVDRVAAGLWNWDGQTSLWSRFWVIIYSINGVPWSRSPTWGSPDLPPWGTFPQVSRGSSALVSDVQSIRGIVNEWKPAASRCERIMVSFDPSAFAPTDASPPLPDGTWGQYWDIASLSANRDSRAIYWKGV
jgi:hypothetical protein